MSSLSTSNTTSFSDRYGRLLPGLLLSGVIAWGAIQLGKLEWMQSHGMSALTLAIMLGIVLGNSVYGRLAPTCGAGVTFSKQTLLRLGIILYGFRLTFQDIGQVGLAGIAIDALVLASTFGLAMFLGTKVFKLERNSAILIGAGSSICGAAAVMATEPVVKGRSEDVTVAVSTVVVFGTIAIFLYPLLYQLNQGWHVLAATPSAFGVYIGSTVHEVAQVVAAGKSIGQEAANAAVIAKMVRVMMLAPFLVILSAVLARGKAKGGNGGHDKAAKLAIPWFAFIFIGVVAFNSLGLLPAGTVATITELDTVLLAMAMAALGLTTHMSAIRRAGIKPLLLAGLLFCWLIAGGAAINHMVASLFA
ncbi:YeiH family putative sulfate export transporter [Janthinobacterium sp. BJB301]|uniref:YeiH family protein n=1 Tax=Janthinobacterium sp. BJB301 TaxID=1560195 RepID=UPI000C0C70D7|nr:YeiH family protein [Janthinobacterium sp. BJB301]PHV51020.1 YeiH family putative sulfate export transporter [Janthinobacterium sp. BJB301]